MRIGPGTLLGPYKILSQIGSGAMGEVYLAKDTRIGREVAIKVISAALSGDPTHHYRLEQEARAAGSINHPNILAIYDVGTFEGCPFIVSEKLVGETLRQRLSNGDVPQQKAINYALQIARGLAAAHDRNIIHRDLKPENIFVTKEGYVKILDFGLVKITKDLELSDSQAGVSTVTHKTHPGMITGTVGYMSPEQARALPVDHRSDIFSFGAILYETLWGERAFRRPSAVETLNAILNEEPERLSDLNGKISPEVVHLVGRCLEKNPEDRFQSTRDLVFNLESLTSVSRTGPASMSTLVPRSKTRVWWVLAFALLVAALSASAFFIGRGSVDPTPASFRQVTFRRGTLQDARFAPDGQTIYYSAWWDDKKSRIYWTRPGNPESSALDLPEGSGLLSVSSSGELAVLLSHGTSLGFRGVLARIPPTGGAPREILENVQWADWAPNGTQLAVVRQKDQRNVLEFPIGTTLYQTNGLMLCPRVSINGDMVAFIHRPTLGVPGGAVMVVDQNGKSTVLSAGWSNILGLAWSASGNEVWFTAAQKGGNRAVYAVNLSGKLREVMQLPNRVTLTDISRDGRVLLSRESFQGGMMYRGPGDTKERDLYWFDGTLGTDLSDDGKTILFVEAREATTADFVSYLRRTDSSQAIRLGEGFVTDLSPDGKWAISISRGSPAQLTILPTGAGEPKQVTGDTINHLHDYGPSNNFLGAFWFPDGQRILFSGIEPGHDARCYVQNINGGAPQPITPDGTICLLISPDSKFIVTLNPDQQAVLYPVEGGSPVPIKGLEKGDVPIQWSADGRALYVHQDKEVPNRIYLVDLSTGQKTFWKELVPPDLTGLLYLGPVLVTPDGKSYIYSYGRNQSDLYLVSGLK